MVLESKCLCFLPKQSEKKDDRAEGILLHLLTQLLNEGRILFLRDDAALFDQKRLEQFRRRENIFGP